MLSTVATLTEHGVNLVSDKENFDTSTPQGKFVLTVFAALSEFERESILERQQEGIEIAKAEGKYKGRKPIPANEKFFHSSKGLGRWKGRSQGRNPGVWYVLVHSFANASSMKLAGEVVKVVENHVLRITFHSMRVLSKSLRKNRKQPL